MKVTVIGSGYVGLISAACLADLGHEVICIDQDVQKIKLLKQGVAPIFEDGLEALLAKPSVKERLQFKIADPTACQHTDIIIIAVGTPTLDSSGVADLTAVFEAVKSYAPFTKPGAVMVIKSTVPVQTGHQLCQMLEAMNLSHQIHIASNPEFLREGSAIQDFMAPNRIIVGAGEAAAFAPLRQLYQLLIDRGHCYIEMDRASAELTKYASNAFLATKVAFINEIADLCEHVGASVEQVSFGMGKDPRIGPLFLQAGPGYGGSCFPKDTRALVATARAHQSPVNIVEAVGASNSARAQTMADKVIKACGGRVVGKKLAFLGVTFKAHTDDVRESPALGIIQLLQTAGATIVYYDPKAHVDVEGMLVNCERKSSPAAALSGADAAVIVTAWPEFKAILPAIFIKNLNSPVVIDLRNLLLGQEMAQHGITYVPLGLQS